MIFSFYDSVIGQENDFLPPYSFNMEKIKEFEDNQTLFSDYFETRNQTTDFPFRDFFYSIFRNERIESFSQLSEYLKTNSASLSNISDHSFVFKTLISEISSRSTYTTSLFNVSSNISRTFDWKYSLKDPIKFYNDLFVFDIKNHQKNLANGYVCFDVSNATDQQSNISFYYYTKRNKIASSNQGDTYSLISKTSYEDHIRNFVFPSNITFEEKSLLQISNFASARSYYNIRTRENKPILTNFDFIFDDNLLSQKLETTDSTKVDVIKVPSFSSLSKDNTIEKTSYTKKQVLSRNTSFVPILVQHKIVDQSLNKVDIKLLSFISSYSISNLFTKKRSASRFLEFIKDLTQNDSLKIFNFPLYLAKMKKKFSSLFQYSSETLQKLSDAQKEELLNYPINNSYEPFSTSLNSLILSTPNIDQKLKTKYFKLKQKTDTNLSFLKSQNNCYNNVFSTISEIDNLQKQINSLNNSLIEKKKDLNTYSQQLSNSLNSLFAIYPLYNKIEEKYNEAYFTSKDFSVDQFLNNYATQGITILEITFFDSDNLDKKFTLNSSSSKEILSKFLISKKSNKLSIRSLRFCTSTPTKIKVVGSSNQFVYGGPYVVQVSQNKIQISLKDKTSLFGYNPTSSYFVHPHSGSSNSFQSLYYPNFSNACLGEASPLLFKAFQDNNIKTILISAMTWVSSANSADTWGKNYIYFPKVLDLLEVKDDHSLSKENNNISENEVVDFLSAFSEEDEEDQEENTNLTFTPNELVDQVLNDVQETQPEIQEEELDPNQQPNETVYVRYTGNA